MNESVAGRNWTLFSTTYLDTCIQYITDYLKDAVEHLILFFIAYITLCIILYLSAVHWKHIGGCDLAPKRVLFVVAHPDDECMFFGPTIIKHTSRQDCQVYLLCLSKGNSDGLGSVRAKELWKSGAKLQIPDENIILINNSLLQDNPKVSWREDVIARIILTHIEELRIDTLITFDRHGVSRHKNHCSIFYAVAFLCLDSKIPSYCNVYTLESTNILRKYWLLLDVPLSYLLSSYRYILNWKERCQIIDAMHEHKSQLVWFRRLYLLISRYTMINTLNQMNVIDLELDLEIDPD